MRAQEGEHLGGGVRETYVYEDSACQRCSGIQVVSDVRDDLVMLGAGAGYKIPS